MDTSKGDKIARVLDLYTKLMNGYLIRKDEEAERYGVNAISMTSAVILKTMLFSTVL